MTIRRGEAWGEAGRLREGSPVAGSDTEAAAAVADAVLAGETGVVEVGLLGGDLCRTVSGSGRRDRLATDEAQRLPVDAGVVTLDDGPPRVFVAHVLAGRRFTGPAVAVMNAQFAGGWDVAPRSHPNDGRLDVLDARLGPGDRFKAWRRLPLGTHVPHPAITERRVTDAVVDLGARVPVRIDGRPAGRARRLTVRSVADAFTIVI